MRHLPLAAAACGSSVCLLGITSDELGRCFALDRALAVGIRKEEAGDEGVRWILAKSWKPEPQWMQAELRKTKVVQVEKGL